jgi:RHS repeat-associated protein
MAFHLWLIRNFTARFFRLHLRERKTIACTFRRFIFRLRLDASFCILSLLGPGPGKLKWSYDKVGNRLTEVEEFATIVTNSYAYPATNNRITDVKQGTTTVRSFLYDAMGNLTKDTKGTVATDYVYNNRNRLSQAKIGTTIKGNYVYDGFERLAIREVLNTTPSGKTHFLYNEENDVIAETSAATGASFREYIWLPGEGVGGGGQPIAVIDQANTATPKTYWISTDHLDRPVLMTDATRAIVWRAEYRPFGEVISLTGPAATDANLGTQRFPGQWFQLETGLAYNWHRHYDASLGRYTQVDPIGLAGGVSVFGYVGQGPTQTVDRRGLDAITDDMRRLGIKGFLLFCALNPQVCGVNPPQPAPNACFDMGWGRSWTCTASCNVQQVDPSVSCPPRVTGVASGPSEYAACTAAKRAAGQTTPRGCYPRHCRCPVCSR